MEPLNQFAEKRLRIFVEQTFICSCAEDDLFISTEGIAFESDARPSKFQPVQAETDLTGGNNADLTLGNETRDVRDCRSELRPHALLVRTAHESGADVAAIFEVTSLKEFISLIEFEEAKLSSVLIEVCDPRTH